MERGVAPVSVRPWSLLAPDSTRNRTSSRCPRSAAMKRGVGPCWHRTPPEIGRLQGAPDQLLCVKALLQYMSGLGLCWHRTQPEIGQLQGAPSELLWKEALLQYLSGLGPCWHQTQPEIGQLQGAPDQQQ